MKMSGFAHKGLKRLYAENSTKGVPSDTVDKLRKILAFFDAMRQELRGSTEVALPGDRKGTWSLCVTRNRRLTFTIDDAREIRDVNLEDYH